MRGENCVWFEILHCMFDGYLILLSQSHYHNLTQSNITNEQVSMRNSKYKQSNKERKTY